MIGSNDMDNTGLKIAVIADLHYYSPSLGTTGKAYELRSAQDQKCLAESGAIIDSAFESIKKSGADCVLIAGDLANNGERVCHEEVFEKISDLNKFLPAYTVYATHDWCCDNDAKRFEGDSVFHYDDTLTPPELKELYAPFGKNRAESEYITHLEASSYSLNIGKNIRLIATNDDQNGKGASGYTDEHLDWILSECKKANANGEYIILMQHHMLISSISEIISKSQHIGDNIDVANKLADAGVSLVICGHSHMQRTTRFVSDNGNTLYQLNQGALCGYPAPITYLEINGEEMNVSVESLKEFEYNGKTETLDYIKKHTQNVVFALLEYAANDRDKFFKLLENNGISTDSITNIYPVISKCAHYALTATVGKAGRLLNALTFGKGVNMKAVKKVEDDYLIDYIADLFLSVFDGSEKTYAPSDPVYNIVTDVASLPRRAVKLLPIKKLKDEKVMSVLLEIEKIAHELLVPSKPDNRHFTFTMQ